ncbi:hypothetical protein [Schleiferia thermophila]
MRTILILYFFSVLAFGQKKYVLKFENYHNNHLLKIDSIKIINISRQIDTTLYYPNDVFELIESNFEFDFNVFDNQKRFSVINNINSCETYFRISIDMDQPVQITVTDVSGRVIQQFRKRLASGKHYFTIQGGGNNVYIINVDTRRSKDHAKIFRQCDNKSLSLNLLYSEETQSENDKNTFDFRRGDSIEVRSYSVDFDDEVFIGNEIFIPTESRIFKFKKFTDYKALVIMYHKITLDTASDLYERSVWDFENDLTYIKNKGYTVVSIEELEDIYK